MNPETPCTLNKYKDILLRDSAENHAETTNDALRSNLNQITEAFKNHNFTEIRYSTIKGVMATWQKEGKSNKTVSNYLTPMRKIFKLATQDGVFAINPMDGITNPKQPKEVIEKRANQDIDPYTAHQVNLLESAETTCASGQAMTAIMNRTGLRPEEGVCASWEGLDWKAKTYTVSMAKPKNDYRCPKTTNGQRTIELGEDAMAILREHYKLTGHFEPITVSVVCRDNRTREDVVITPMFIREKTGQPYKHPKDFFQTYLRPTLQSLGIRERGVSQCRKTYACHALSSNVPIKWLANQLGHADTLILEKHYAKWTPKPGDITPAQMIDQRLAVDHQSTTPRPTEPVKPWYRRLKQAIKIVFNP